MLFETYTSVFFKERMLTLSFNIYSKDIFFLLLFFFERENIAQLQRKQQLLYILQFSKRFDKHTHIYRTALYAQVGH